MKPEGHELMEPVITVQAGNNKGLNLDNGRQGMEETTRWIQGRFGGKWYMREKGKESRMSLKFLRWSAQWMVVQNLFLFTV